jgi:hypothetical protein
MPCEASPGTSAHRSVTRLDVARLGRKQLVALLGVIWVAALVFSSCGGSGERKGPDPSPESPTGSAVPTLIVTPTRTQGPTTEPTPAPDPVLVGAGDNASCTQENDVLTAGLLDTVISGASGEAIVFTAGDNVYQSGTLEEYEQCYHPTWGRHRDRTRPAPGNHEYGTGNADGYFTYFGAAAGDPDLGYYSYDLGAWHIVVLNTSDHCKLISCLPGSPQEQWLRADLAAHPAACTLAIWHDPLFASGSLHGGSPDVAPFWQALYEYGAELVVNGHEHNYERFAPQTPSGNLDMQYGIREIIAGTGGESHYRAGESLIANSEAANDETYGVIKLALHPTTYDWEFLAEEGQTFRDSGSGPCHGSPQVR